MVRIKPAKIRVSGPTILKWIVGVAILSQAVFMISYMYKGCLQFDASWEGFTAQPSGASRKPMSVPARIQQKRESPPSDPKQPPPDVSKVKPEHSMKAVATDEEEYDPGGLILTSYFSFRQDPRHIGKYEHKLATFETIYHFYTTVVHHRLKAIIFHDGIVLCRTAFYG